MVSIDQIHLLVCIQKGGGARNITIFSLIVFVLTSIQLWGVVNRRGTSLGLVAQLQALWL
jgi:hypothetical protein